MLFRSGDIAFKDAVAMVAAVATHESGLRVSVEKCHQNGDGGLSIGLGQVMQGPAWGGHTRKEICSSRKLQLKLALRVLDLCWSKTPNHEATFRCYAAGDAKKFSYSARNQFALYTKIRFGLNKDLAVEKASTALANPKLRLRPVITLAVIQKDHNLGIRPKVVVIRPEVDVKVKLVKVQQPVEVKPTLPVKPVQPATVVAPVVPAPVAPTATSQVKPEVHPQSSAEVKK